jgi:RecA/RadA recombinase
MKRLKLTYKELYELIEKDQMIEYHVKDHNGEFTKVIGINKKQSDTYDIDISDGAIKMTVGDRHAFMNSIGNAVVTEDLVPGDQLKSLHGNLLVTSVDNFKKDQEVYDIAISDPHWYTNDDSHGLIHHNSLVSLQFVSAYMGKHKDAVCLFYDSEFGMPENYFTSNDVDVDRVIHLPVKNIEELKFDIMQQLEAISKDDKVIIFIDSIGNLSSKKEMDDAIDGKSVADMSRAKMLKSLFRMVTPYLTMKDIPMIAVNHVYNEIGLYPKAIVGGGQGVYLSADTIFIMGRRQNKKGTEVKGYDFIMNIEKSRYVREKSKLPITVSWEGGIDKYSGLLEIARQLEYVTSPKNGWYTRPMIEGDKNWRAGDSSCAEFWDPLLLSDEFKTAITRSYEVGSSPMEGDMDE